MLKITKPPDEVFNISVFQHFFIVPVFTLEPVFLPLQIHLRFDFRVLQRF